MLDGIMILYDIKMLDDIKMIGEIKMLGDVMSMSSVSQPWHDHRETASGLELTVADNIINAFSTEYINALRTELENDEFIDRSVVFVNLKEQVICKDSLLVWKQAITCNEKFDVLFVGELVGYLTLRVYDSACDVPDRWCAEPLLDQRNRILDILAKDSPMNAAMFACCYPLFRQLLLLPSLDENQRLAILKICETHAQLRSDLETVSLLFIT